MNPLTFSGSDCCIHLRLVSQKGQGASWDSALLLQQSNRIHTCNWEILCNWFKRKKHPINLCVWIFINTAFRWEWHVFNLDMRYIIYIYNIYIYLFICLFIFIHIYIYIYRLLKSKQIHFPFIFPGQGIPAKPGRPWSASPSSFVPTWAYWRSSVKQAPTWAHGAAVSCGKAWDAPYGGVQTWGNPLKN